MAWDRDKNFTLFARDSNDEIVAESDIVTVDWGDLDMLHWIDIDFDLIDVNKNGKLTLNDWISIPNKFDIEVDDFL